MPEDKAEGLGGRGARKWVEAKRDGWQTTQNLDQEIGNIRGMLRAAGNSGLQGSSTQIKPAFHWEYLRSCTAEALTS